MECKVLRSECSRRPIADLIETLWNVKITWSEMDREELVGFNRDIVECKGTQAVDFQVDLY